MKFKALSRKNFSSVPVMMAIAVSFNPKLVHVVDQCAVSTQKSPTVYLVKQWHLAPNTNTKLNPPVKPLPQTKNQTQIYDQLGEWVQNGVLDTAIAEGCEGEVGPKLKEAFQGWTYEDLTKHVNDKNYSELLAHPVLKFQAKYSSKAKSYCGDSLSEIKRSQVALSDARADVGYFGRLSENQDKPEKLKPYLDGVIEMYHLRANSGYTDALKAVAIDLKKSLDIFQDSTHERDLAFIRKINTVDSPKPTVLVVGGLHAQDLKDSLEKKKMNCVIFEPLAYQNDEEAMSKKLKSLLK
jgi:hypothetical protein